jgi:hypothetical protein
MKYTNRADEESRTRRTRRDEGGKGNRRYKRMNADGKGKKPPKQKTPKGKNKGNRRYTQMNADGKKIVGAGLQPALALEAPEVSNLVKPDRWTILAA